MATASFLQPTYRSSFIAGWDKYVKHGVFGQQVPPDVYWNPRKGQWLSYAPGEWTIVDKNLPSIPESTFANAGTIFDEITQQWSALPSVQQQEGVWDGRRYRWVLAEVGKASCRAEVEDKIAFLRQLHADGTLDDDMFQKEVDETLKRYEHCM